MTVWLLAYPDIVPDIGHLRHRYIMIGTSWSAWQSGLAIFRQEKGQLWPVSRCYILFGLSAILVVEIAEKARIW
jgi:hypothetical protein